MYDHRAYASSRLKTETPTAKKLVAQLIKLDSVQMMAYTLLTGVAFACIVIYFYF